MRKNHFFFLTFLSFSFLGISQTPQFAVVKPNGTTTITTSFDDAYTAAADGDIIYMPGITISGSKTISKKLTLIGAGHYPDSTLYTGKTIFSGAIDLEKNCTLEGFELQGLLNITTPNGSNSIFSRLKFSALYLNGTSNHFIDGCVFQDISGSNSSYSCTTPSTNIVIKNSILTLIHNIKFSSFRNCIFLGFFSGNTIYLGISNSIFSNCIFRGIYDDGWLSNFPSCDPIEGNSSNNCVWDNISSAIQIPGVNNFGVNTNIVFESGNTGAFNYTNNYHLRAGSPYLNAGDDGTEIGIYGGSTPYKEGAVPSNPHIYFKQVAPQTNNNGQLQIQFKVRTNN